MNIRFLINSVFSSHLICELRSVQEVCESACKRYHQFHTFIKWIDTTEHVGKPPEKLVWKTKFAWISSKVPTQFTDMCTEFTFVFPKFRCRGQMASSLLSRCHLYSMAVYRFSQKFTLHFSFQPNRFWQQRNRKRCCFENPSFDIFGFMAFFQCEYRMWHRIKPYEINGMLGKRNGNEKNAIEWNEIPTNW